MRGLRPSLTISLSLLQKLESIWVHVQFAKDCKQLLVAVTQLF